MRTVIGKIDPGSTVGLRTVKLTLKDESRNFVNGLLVRVTWALDQDAREGRARVMGVDDVLGTVTFSKPLSQSIPAVLPGDFLLLDVDEPRSY